MRTVMSRIILAAIIAGIASCAFATEGMLSVSPAVIMLAGEAGQSTTQTLTLTNSTDRAFSFDLEANDVVVRNGKRAFASAGELAGSIAATAVFTPRHVSVAPGSAQRVSVTVTIPRDSTTRGVVAVFRGTDRVMNGRMPMTASLGCLMTFRISNEVELDATALRVTPQSSSTNLRVSEDCVNRGKEPLVAKGMLAIVDTAGTLVGKSPLQSHRLMPGESAEISGEYGGDLRSGHYRVLVTYDYEGRTLTRVAEVDVQ